jgi:hypothetical protein
VVSRRNCEISTSNPKRKSGLDAVILRKPIVCHPPEKEMNVNCLIHFTLLPALWSRLRLDGRGPEKKIVLIAGKLSQIRRPRVPHRLLAARKCLRGVKGVNVLVYSNGWPSKQRREISG